MAATEQPTWPEFSAEIKPSLKLIQQPDFGTPSIHVNKDLAALGLPGIESFNFMLRGGLTRAVKDLSPIEFALPSGTRIKLKVENAQIFPPQAAEGSSDRNPTVFPKECRMSGTTYKGKLVVQLGWWVDGKMQIPLDKNLGDIPIMLKSDACHLANLNPAQLVVKGEHAEEFGGYFIVKGHERLLRMLTATRKNFPIAVRREKWKGRGKLFSDKGIFIRCVKPDMTSTNNVLHYLQNGTVKFMCSYQKALYFLPVVLVLKALMNVTDEYIFRELIIGMEDNLYYRERIAFMLRLLQAEGLHSYEQARTFIGKSFRIKFRELPEWYTDEEVCDYLFKKAVMIHLDDNEDKFRALCFSIRKLFAFVQDHCVAEGMDPVMMQEVTLPGHTYVQLLKDKLEKFLTVLRFLILKKARTKTDYQLTQGELFWCLGKSSKLEVAFETFLATGNLPSQADLGLMQTSGLTIVAENINRMRYMSHFKAIHRGAVFADSRSSEVRMLKPDAWGFLCPVHTPDGAPCGLLNHLTAPCQVTNTPTNLTQLPSVLAGLGMISVGTDSPVPFQQCYPVQIEGKVLGYIPDKIASRLVDKLRLMKIRGEKGVPTTLEIVLVPKLKGGVYGQYPGLYLFGGVARMVRPVINLAARAIEMIGTFEQIYLDIAVQADEAIEGVTTHQEITATSFLSNLACLIPFPDFNQSPRNMYQCQMGKQTMGTPCHNWPLQTESKLYRLQTPGSPLVRPGHWDKLGMDNFAMGTNAVVAVVSYTGYDMEDAMVINRSALQRGFAYGQVFKSEFVDLRDLSTGGVPRTAVFQRDPTNPELANFLDLDGLPFPGTPLKNGDPFYSYFVKEEGKYVVEKYKHSEQVFVDNIKLCGLETHAEELRKVCISYRIPRYPSVGDKFASRAGQKGICSQQWPAEDLPFTESGLIPDIVFNPHGFPSRMTIAMMIESMAGKGGAIHGMVHDATPFKFSEDDTAIDYYGRMLEAAGYNYYGTEKMYSGTDGREMKADIFFGIVHYQRLRHMVSDKFQVRSVGPVDIVTQQPIKGRKRGGGVRFGEMERDALVSHGTSFLLHDRLFHCSDKSMAYVCRVCGSILSPILELPKKLSAYSRELPRIPVCKMCKDCGDVQEIELPHVFKFLVAQLAAVNIKVSIKLVAS